MNLSRRAITKGTIAVLVGVPGTVLYLPVVLFVLYLSGISAADQSDASLEKVAISGLLVLWGTAGLVGLIGFWFWVFSKPNVPRKRRLITAGCVLVGVCAVAPLALGGSWLYAGLAGLGCGVGIVICLWLVLPNFPLNPDARQEQPRAG